MTPSIDQTIDRIETLYHWVTGKEAPRWNGNHHVPIRPETASAVVHWSPPMTIRRDGCDHIVDIDLAGVERDTIELQIAGQVLTVAGCRDLPPPAETAPSVLYSERPFGRFQRRIALPEHTATDDVRAELRNGVLSVRIAGASRSSAEPRTVAIT